MSLAVPCRIWIQSQPAQITCMITNTPDMQFTIGALNHSPDIIAAGGCSGHGFKHASAIGEHLAEIALEQKPTVKLEFANPNRF